MMEGLEVHLLATLINKILSKSLINNLGKLIDMGRVGINVMTPIQSIRNKLNSSNSNIMNLNFDHKRKMNFLGNLSNRKCMMTL